MTKEELEQEAEEKYCKGCKLRMEQCLWAWRSTNGKNELKNCSCKGVPSYLAGAEPREKRIAELEAQIEKMKNCKNCANYMISGKCPCFFRTGWCKNWKMAKGVNYEKEN